MPAQRRQRIWEHSQSWIASSISCKRFEPGFRSRARLSSAGHDPGVVKTLKGAAAKSSRALAIHLRGGNAAWYAAADANLLRGS